MRWVIKNSCARVIFITLALLFSCKDRYDTVEEYWKRPIKPNGEPPKTYSALEASLDPKACGSCHAEKYTEWQQSLHSKTISSGLLWQMRMMDQLSANKCMDCHAPLSEQKALMAIYMNYPSRPQKPAPAYITDNLHLQGVICAACHVREHTRYGPPPTKTLPSVIPHGGFKIRDFFQDSKFCAACHQFPPNGERTNGKLRQDTYEEWRKSIFYSRGITCQSCHMPNRKHTWEGIHNRNMVLSALRIEVWVEGENFNIELINVGAGHKLPTYMVPKIVVKISQKNREIIKGIVGWMVDEYDLSKEMFDTRIAPGKSLIFTGKLIDKKESIKVLIIVEPEEHYYRAFGRYLKDNKNNLSPVVLSLLKDAVKRVRKTNYVLLNSILNPERLAKGRYILNYGATF